MDKYLLNLAGEYRVCSELLKRGLFATMTYGNRKGADIYAIGSNQRAAVIEVKTSSSRRFVTGFYQKYNDEFSPHPTFWVLHSLQQAPSGFTERFFVLTHEEMAFVQAQRVPATARLPYARRASVLSNGVDNVLIEHVVEHEDAWAKILTYCSNAG